MLGESDEIEAPDASDDEPTEAIGIALSGGGTRAALYSLGVLLYLVHSGLNKRVRLISSVSGGSIVNAALSVAGDYSRASSQDFNKIASMLANQLAKEGVFFWPNRLRITLWLQVLTILLFLPVFVLITAASIPKDEFVFTQAELHSKFIGIWALSLIGVAILWIFLYSSFGRRAAQINRYGALVARIQGHRNVTTRSGRRMKLTDALDSRVRHILCATELTSGRPIYMDRHEIYSPAYGSGNPNLSLAKAIYASAAFPVGFPPLRVSTASLNMSGGDMEERPTKFLLSDGGVFNNLGTDSFTAWTTKELDPFMLDTRFVELPTIGRRIIVNASSPGRLANFPRIWGWRNIAIVQRIMAILYENTVRPRVEALLGDETKPNGPLIIDIANSPIDITERLIKYDNDPGERRRADDTLQRLKNFKSTSYWYEYSVRASGTRTVLRAIGATAAVRLLRLGYLSATIACYVRLDSAGLDKVPPETWFQELVDSQTGVTDH